MRTSKSNNRWSRLVLAAALGSMMVLGGSGVAVQAADDEEFQLPDAKLLDSFMRSMGLKKEGDEIEYRERAPLVLPTSRDLPPPERVTSKAKAPDWPDDPDVKRARKAKAERKYVNPEPEDAGRPLTPNQYSLPGGASGSSRPTGGERSAEEIANPMSPYALGSKSLWSSVWSGSKDEYATFTTEPPRQRLIDPPAGYRTPSPNQPYGVGASTVTSAQTPVANRNDAVK